MGSRGASANNISGQKAWKNLADIAANAQIAYAKTLDGKHSDEAKNKADTAYINAYRAFEKNDLELNEKSAKKYGNGGYKVNDTGKYLYGNGVSIQGKFNNGGMVLVQGKDIYKSFGSYKEAYQYANSLTKK